LSTSSPEAGAAATRLPPWVSAHVDETETLVSTYPMITVAELLRRHRSRQGDALVVGDRSWTWSEYLEGSETLASILAARVTAERPHVGVLSRNSAVFAHLLAASGLGGPALAGLNLTRRGSELVRDAAHTDCSVIIVDDEGADLLSAAGDLERDFDVVHELEVEGWLNGAARVDVPDVDPADLFMLIFTSGSTGAPKAVKTSNGKVAQIAQMIPEWYGLGSNERSYISMPMFHSNAVLNGWAPTIAVGGTLVVRPRFSASGFIEDVRRHGVTYATYVGKPLNYILQTPPRLDDRDNTLRLIAGNEALERDIVAFAERFDCRVIDAFGSTEGGVGIRRDESTPPGSLGRLDDNVAIIRPDGSRAAVAQFDADRVLLNPEEAIGELTNMNGRGGFEGYYKNDEAEDERLRGGLYRSGDLAYVDDSGYAYFAGRTADWVRVDGENIGLALVDRCLQRAPGVALATAYGVRGEIGDHFAAALVVQAGASFDPRGFVAALDADPDMSPKWWPRWVTVLDALPTTATNKVLRRELAAAGAPEAGPGVFERDTATHTYVELGWPSAR
jgi:fatty-acyl-CoA synthase